MMDIYRLLSQEQDRVNIGAWQERSVANGPGERFVLWVQGCIQRCQGCINKEFLPFIDRRWMSIDNLFRMIMDIQGIEGVTYTGGEPIIQARALAILSKKLKAQGMTIVCYTGYTLEFLRKQANSWIDELLSNVDIIIDGPYIQALSDHLLWRGSSNQKMYFLSDKYRHFEQQSRKRRSQVEFTIGKREFITTGNWPHGFLERLEEKLRR